MIKKFLKKLIAQGWTQEQIAEKAGMRQSQISKLLKDGDVKASTVIKIAKAFEVSADMVLSLDEQDQPEEPPLKPQTRSHAHKGSNSYAG